jgi:hypothetical protein
MKSIITILFLLCSLGLFSQTTYYVRPDGNDNNYSISWASVVERRIGVLPDGTIYLGSQYLPGTYFIEIIQGDSKQTLKLIKQAVN